MGDVPPSICAGHGMPCPYDGNVKSTRKFKNEKQQLETHGAMI
jgi:hypothetical protein